MVVYYYKVNIVVN